MDCSRTVRTGFVRIWPASPGVDRRVDGRRRRDRGRHARARQRSRDPRSAPRRRHPSGDCGVRRGGCGPGAPRCPADRRADPIAMGCPGGQGSVGAIPAQALFAYQRAAIVIDLADPSCHLFWPLLAAIGRVESDHGQYAGNRLDSAGIARPGVFWPRLDGRTHTSVVRDTDSGGTTRAGTSFDRAVGPMQFIPGTGALERIRGRHRGTAPVSSSC